MQPGTRIISWGPSVYLLLATFGEPAVYAPPNNVLWSPTVSFRLDDGSTIFLFVEKMKRLYDGPNVFALEGYIFTPTANVIYRAEYNCDSHSGTITV